MLNEVILIGRLGQEPEVKQINNGTKVVTFSLPLFHSYTKENQKTQWIRCEAWSKLGNIVEMAQKGTLVSVRGELHNEVWEDEEGKWRNRTFLRIESFRFLEKRKDGTLVEKFNQEKPGDIKKEANESTNDEPIYTGETITDVDQFLNSF